jgi:hypothetical protein
MRQGRDEMDGLPHLARQCHVTDRSLSSTPFKRFRTAWRTLVGYETLAMMRKGQVTGIGGDDIVAQAAFVNSLFDIAA